MKTRASGIKKDKVKYFNEINELMNHLEIEQKSTSKPRKLSQAEQKNTERVPKAVEERKPSVQAA